MIKLKKPNAGFYLLAVSLVFSVIAAAMYAATFAAFKYNTERWVVALMVIGIWSLALLLVNGLIGDEKHFWVDILYVIAMLSIAIAAFKFFTPCLSPIGIYFTVHNMGDVEANAVGVPRSLITLVFFLLAIFCLAAASFFRISGGKRA